MDDPSGHASPPPVGLRLDGVDLKRSERLIASGLKATFAAHSTTVLRGANGAGKTTMLRAMAGFLTPAAGTISLCTEDNKEDTTTSTGAPASAHPDHLRRTCVFFGHANAVKYALTVRENIDFWAGLYGLTDETAIVAALKAVDLTALAHRRADTLSAGQRRRLGFARVLLSGKPVWLLDEPTASMDAASIERLCALIRERQTDGGCIIIATHDTLPLEAQSLTLGPANSPLVQKTGADA